MLGSLLGSLVGVVSPSTSSAAASTASSSAPSLSASPSVPSSPIHSSDSAPPCTVADIENDPFLRSAYFQRLLKRGVHAPTRIQAIKDAALAEDPPREPEPEECCNEACGLECVVSIWWEEEKTWRDMHPDWKAIKRRLKEEEEDRQREAEEEAALNGDDDGGSTSEEDVGIGEKARKGRGAPELEIGLEEDERGWEVKGVEQALEKLQVG
ncbi:hypothetical protein JCM10450v2_000936 [Rhodotorula kratochvilovae]